MKYTIAAFLFFAYCSGASLLAQTVKIDGTWTLTIPTSNLPEAGGDYAITSYESDPNGFTLDVTGSGSKKAWQIDIRRIDYDWDDRLGLYVRR
ncbi:MAG: hypothetical protein R3350_03200, partial [Saprospiraceae bacterium]|nr:hypothetical protein [Saprospiraceae bacterium]